MIVSDKKYNLLCLAEDSAYSSKGHFKTADWISIFPKVILTVPLLISFVLMAFPLSDLVVRVLSAFAFGFSLFALTSFYANNQEKARVVIDKHMDLGNQYLAVYKNIRSLYCMRKEIEEGEIQNITSRLSDLNVQSGKNRIHLMGRYWSLLVIKRQMDLDWIYKGKRERLETA